MRFEEYFSFEAIVGDLIRWRLRGRDLGGVLPPRKDWQRAGLKGRKGVPSEVVRRQAIWRTVMRACGAELGGHAGRATLPTRLGWTPRPTVAARRGDHTTDAVRRGDRPTELRWVRNLMKLVDEVQGAVFSGKVAFETPRMIKIEKGRERGVIQYREVASFDRLSDRVILSRMTAYVRDRLEASLTEHCYSFRRDASITHQSAVKRLQEFRERFPAGSLFVAECDIKKFFDNISHEVVRRRWGEIGFDERAGKVLEAYLAVYAVGGESNGQDVRCPSRGLAQGGSFSTVLANLVLAAADQAVQDVDDGRLFCARYCDDVVFVHPDEAMCCRAMAAYQAALAKLDLPMHPVRPFVYKTADGATTEYYSIKSKGPFRWREAGKGEVNCASWVSFLGSQIRYDGETRIRKESIEKHIRSLGSETAKAVREIVDGKVGRARRGEPSSASRGSAGRLALPCAAAWFARFRNRLIAKGVGYVTAKVQDCGMCWAGAFPNVTACADTKMQMRRLDRVREGLLCKVWNAIRSCGTHDPNNAARRDASPYRRDLSGRPTRRYKGRPFSYFGFLEKAVRPTNMSVRRVRTRALPYSEM